MKAYVVAVLTTALIGLIRIVFHDQLGDVAPFGPFLVLVVIVAWLGGLRPGLLATLLGALTGTFLLVPPYYSFHVVDPLEAIGLTLYSIVGVITSLFCELLHMARRRAEAAEAAVRQRERLFLSLAVASSQSIWHFRPGAAAIAQIDEANALWWREFTGQTEAERTAADGFGWLNAVHEEDRATARQSWEQVVSSDRPLQAEYRVRRRDGEWRRMVVTGMPLQDERSHAIEWAGLVIDVTEKRAAEEENRRLHRELVARVDELQELDRKKDEFLAILAHELRNPLAPLRSGLEVLRLAPDDPRMGQESLAIMERQLAQMVRLVDDLFDLSRFRRGLVELKRERVDLTQVISQAVETSRPLIDAGGHELALELPAEPVYVEADVTRLAQVFSNVLNNAAKYTERGGEITLAARREGPTAVVRVRDTGRGLPADMLESVFDMFTQVDRSLEKTHGGLGIGLSLVKRLVEMHGGTVEAHSAGAGQGSEFVVRVPAVEVPRNTRPQVRTNNEQSSGRRVLIVDDNRDVALSLAMLLRATGHETQTAFDGSEALELAASWNPEVILLDIGMPKLNGYDVCRRLREEQNGKSPLIVALTGWGQERDRQRSAAAGFDHHLVKPVAPGELRDLLAQAPVLADSMK